ncbi:hypothetical protein ACJJTC_008141, partial [Scirpophaga incertulas]
NDMSIRYLTIIGEANSGPNITNLRSLETLRKNEGHLNTCSESSWTMDYQLCETSENGHVNITIESHGEFWGNGARNATLVLPVRVRVIPVPVRSRRLLWDQFHSLRYPGGYFPRDDLRAKHDPLDWHADHLHTNFRDMYRRLRDHGFYLEVMGTPLTCVDTSLYGALLLVDPEDEYFPEEMVALKKAVDNGMSLVVFADWYNASLLRHVKFYDENTRQWWIPETGGANVPALNDLLSMYQVALGDRVFEGSFKLGGHNMYYASGTHIHSFPDHGVLITAQLSDQGHQIMTGEKTNTGSSTTGAGPTVDVPILGLLQTDGETGEVHSNDTIDKVPKAGRLVVYGDSSCLEGGSAKPCHWLLLAALQYALAGHLPPSLKDAATPPQQRLKDVHIIPSGDEDTRRRVLHDPGSLCTPNRRARNRQLALGEAQGAAPKYRPGIEPSKPTLYNRALTITGDNHDCLLDNDTVASLRPETSKTSAAGVSYLAKTDAAEA